MTGKQIGLTILLILLSVSFGLWQQSIFAGVWMFCVPNVLAELKHR